MNTRRPSLGVVKALLIMAQMMNQVFFPRRVGLGEQHISMRPNYALTSKVQQEYRERMRYLRNRYVKA